MGNSNKPTFIQDGHVPMSKGHQPMAIRPPSNEQAGHRPATSQGSPGPGTPPNQGGGGSKK